MLLKPTGVLHATHSNARPTSLKTVKPLTIPDRQFALYELKSLAEALPMLSSLTGFCPSSSGPSALLFPDEGYLACFRQYFGASLSQELLYFTPSSFLDYVLKRLKLQSRVVLEPAYLGLIAELARSFKHPHAELLKEKPVYFLGLLALIQQDTKGCLDPHLHDFFKRLKGLLSAFNLTSLEDACVSSLKQLQTPLFDHLSIVGFSAKHWDQSLSLFLGLHSACHASFFLQHTEGKAQELLIRTLEIYTGQECTYLGEATPSPEVFNEFSLHVVAFPLNIEDKLMQDILLHLEQAPDKDLVLVFNSASSPSGLALSLKLDALGIPYFSALKRPLVVPESLNLLRSWLHYQKELNIDCLLDWLNSLLYERSPVLLSKLCQKIKNLSALYATSHTAIIVKALERTLKKEEWLLALIRPLKPSARWSDYRDYLLQASIAAKLQWELWLPALGAEQQLDFPIHASSFLIYLEAMLKAHLDSLQQPISLKKRPSIYLLNPDLAVHVQNAKIILAHLNEAQEGYAQHPFLSEATIARFNASLLRSGPNGEGDEFVFLPHGYYNSSQHLNAYQRYMFQNLALVQKHALSHAFVVLDAEGGQLSQVLAHEAVQCLKMGLGLDDKRLEACRVKLSPKEALCESSFPRLFDTEKDHLKRVHLSRQDPTLAFDAYSFCLHTEDSERLVLPAKAWEEFFQKPTGIWFKHILKAESWPVSSGSSSTALLIGTWVHDWLTLASQSKSLKVDDTHSWRLQVLRQSETALENIKSLYQSCELAVHPSLIEHWKKAQGIALNLIETLKQAGIHYLVSEWPLPGSTSWALPQGSVLHLIGRIDAIASSQPIDLKNPLSHKDEALWILDFKTGKTPPLDVKKLSKDASGLQVGLYALALRALGFRNIRCSIVLPKAQLEPQLVLEEIESLPDIYSRMEAVLQSGVFGMKPGPHSPYTSIPYPIATIAVHADVLQAKASLSGLF
jgi:hypothetical protein